MEQREPPITAANDKGQIDSCVLELSEAEAEVRRAAFRSIRTGGAPDALELARVTGLDAATVEGAVGSLVRKGQAVVDTASRVVGSAGLSRVPARHQLRLGDDELHTWCAIDAIGIPAALGVDAVASTACPTCSRSIELEFRKGRVSDDEELRAWMPADDSCASVVDELCPQMNLFCNEEHLEAWLATAGEPAGTSLTVSEVQEMGRQWWGDL